MLVRLLPNDDDVECIEFISRIVTSERTYIYVCGYGWQVVMKMTGIEESIVKLQSVNLTATKLFYVHVYRTSIHSFAHCVSHTDSIFNSISALSATRHSL